MAVTSFFVTLSPLIGPSSLAKAGIDDCEFEPNGDAILPLSACGATNIALEPYGDSIAQWIALRVMQSTNDAFRDGDVDLDTWDYLIQKAILPVEATAQFADWHGIKTLTQANLIPVRLPGMNDFVIQTFDRSSDVLGFASIGTEPTPMLALDNSSRLTDVAIEESYAYYLQYLDLTFQSGVPYFFSLRWTGSDTGGCDFNPDGGSKYALGPCPGGFCPGSVSSAAGFALAQYPVSKVPKRLDVLM
ncbi:MAG: hypothetical protein ACI87A_002552 [Planctomycetota bacterium]